MGLARFPPAPKVHVTHTLTCWTRRKRFTARRIDATYCSSACKNQSIDSGKRAGKFNGRWTSRPSVHLGLCSSIVGPFCRCVVERAANAVHHLMRLFPVSTHLFQITPTRKFFHSYVDIFVIPVLLLHLIKKPWNRGLVLFSPQREALVTDIAGVVGVEIVDLKTSRMAVRTEGW